jgi:DNA invertase Pin-like site-specific DNA recombinase
MDARVVGVWREAALSSRQRRNGLPVRDRVLRGAWGKIDVLLVVEPAALGRSLNDLVRVAAALNRMMVQVMVASENGEGAQPLNAMLLEAARVRYQHEAAVEGRQRAVARGQRLGRPPIPLERIERARAALTLGAGLRAAARAAGIGVASVSRLKASGEA